MQPEHDAPTELPANLPGADSSRSDREHGAPSVNVGPRVASAVSALKDIVRDYCVAIRLKRTLRSALPAARPEEKVSLGCGPLNTVTNDHYAMRRLGRILASADLRSSPKQLFASVDDRDWRWLNTKGFRKSTELRRILPALPDEAIQINYTGAAGDKTLRQAFTHYQLFRQLVTAHGGDLRRYEAILDFGCGWGRIIRFFLRDVDPSVLWGVDVDERMIEFCKHSNNWCKFLQIDPLPPTQLPADTFDLIFSFSVFSHLSEDMHKRWLIEIRRILKPGGIFIATTRNRKFFRWCARLRTRSDLPSLPHGIKISAKAFTSPAQSRRDYDAGKYCFASHGHEGESAYWGDTAIPKSYVLDQWTKHFVFLDYVADSWLCSQNVIVVRK
jgi:SAM-dependent methyltransferase